MAVSAPLETCCWSTTAFGSPADTSPHELAALGEHLRGCRDGQGRLFRWRCRIVVLRGFVISHVVTSLSVGLTLLGLGLLL